MNPIQEALYEPLLREVEQLRAEVSGLRKALEDYAATRAALLEARAAETSARLVSDYLLQKLRESK